VARFSAGSSQSWAAASKAHACRTTPVDRYSILPWPTSGGPCVGYSLASAPRTMAGSFAMTVKYARAAESGWRPPCSHSCSARLLMP
jgi:hypothetical protein